MTTDRVLDRSEMSLNGVRYRLSAPIKEGYGSRFAPKFITGDFNKDTHEIDSIWAPTFQGGIGKNRIHPSDTSDKAWWATWQLRYDHQLVPLQLATQTAASGTAGVFTVGAIGTFDNVIYASFGTDIRSYNTGLDSWSSVGTLPAVATDVLNFRLNNVTYLAFATDGGYSYSSNGSSWTDDTQDAQYLAHWDNRLWGIDSTGQLWYSYNIGVEQNDAQLPLPNSSVTALFTAPNAKGDDVLYAGTTLGLYVHDNDFTKWRKTKLPLPYHPDNCQGSVVWRGFSFVPSGLGIYQVLHGEGGGAVTIMGPDLDDGLPSDRRGNIIQLVPSHNDLLAIITKTTASSVLNNKVTAGMGNHHRGTVTAADTGISTILGWNEIGWECKWTSADAAEAISYAQVSFAYNESRLWWGAGGRVYFMPIPRDIVNPQEITTLTYAASAELISPWLEPDRDADSVGIYLNIDVDGLTSATEERLTVDYAVNNVATWTGLGTIIADGLTEYRLPSASDLSGSEFRSFRFRLTGARGSTITNKPVVRSIIFAYVRKLPPKYTFEAEVALGQGYKDRTPKQLRDALRTAIESKPFVPMSIRNDSGSDFGATDRRFYVDVRRATNIQETGDDERGSSTVTMVEV